MDATTRAGSVNSVPPEGDAQNEFVDRFELSHRLGLHARTVARMVERGELPRPCLSAGGRPRWLWSHVVDYCHQRHLREQNLDGRRTRKLRFD